MTEATKPAPSGFSADTEILTHRGWLTFDQLASDDEVATRSPWGQFIWHRPTKCYCRSYVGEMVEFRNKKIDLLVAPGHPVLIRRSEAYVRRHPRAEGQDWHTQSAEDLSVTRTPGLWEVAAGSLWGGKKPAQFFLPGHEANRWHPAWEEATEWLAGYLTAEWTVSAEARAAAKARGISHHAYQAALNNLGVKFRRRGSTRHGPGNSIWETSRPTRKHVPVRGAYQPAADLRIPMKAFCSFLGLYIAEGWVRNDRNDIIISQYPTSRHLPEIRGILDAIGLYWTYDAKHNNFTVTHKALAAWLRENCGHLAHNKYVPPGFKDHSPDLLEAMLRGMMIGDGHWGPVDQRYYTTTSVRLADDVQEIFQKLGCDSWIRPQDLRKYATLSARVSFVVRERLSDSHGLPRATQREYCGNLYDVSVPNGVVYVRRDGRAIWTATGAMSRS